MEEQFRQILRTFAGAEIAKLPRFIFMKRFYEKLTQAFSKYEAAIIVSRMVIDVDDEFIKDESLVQETVETYFKVIVDLRKALSEINPIIFWETVKCNANPITIKCMRT